MYETSYMKIRLFRVNVDFISRQQFSKSNVSKKKFMILWIFQFH